MDLTIKVRNVDLRSAQEQVEDNLGQMRRLSRSAIRAYAGLWGMTYDEARRMIERSRSMMERAEERGENIEEKVEDRVDSVRSRIENELNRVEKQVERTRNGMRNRLDRAERRTGEEIEEQVERTLERLGIPSKEQIVRLSAEIEALSAKIDREIVDAETMAPSEPFPGYSEMNVKKIVARLDGLTIAQLSELRNYESSNENRVTVLREVDRRIQAMPVPQYDELNVEEVEALLPTLNVEQLDRIEAYEKSHENRVTLLRRIRSERKLKA